MRKPYQKIAFLGLGYVGLCTAVTFAAKGFKVVGIDVDEQRVQTIMSGKAPFYEPDLDSLLKKGLKSSRLIATTEAEDISSARFIFITVGTPSSPDGSINLTQVMDALEKVGRVLRHSSSYNLIVLKSTVIPGTTLEARSRLEKTSGKALGPQLGLCSNPEFLRQGSAIKDTLEPDKLVIGAVDRKSGSELRKLYLLFHRGRHPKIIVTTPQTAELSKYASNAFLATKVSFINSIANICQRTEQIDVEDVAHIIGLDPRIGPLFLKAGPGYGGSCFHKDLQALIHYSQSQGYEPELLHATEEVNRDQADQVVRLAQKLVGDLRMKRVAVLGLAFKKDTDDMREAASLKVIEGLRRKGATIVGYDPMAIENARRILDGDIELAVDVDSALKGADLCILMTEWDALKRIKPIEFIAQMKAPNIVDARRLCNPSDYHRLNYVAIGLGPSTDSSKVLREISPSGLR